MGSPYSLGADTNLPDVDPAMIQRGLQALQSGEVTPQEAADNLKKLKGAQAPKNGPYGVPGGMIGPQSPDENAAVNAQIAKGNAIQAQTNQQQFNLETNPQAGGSQRLAPVEAKSGLSETKTEGGKNTSSSTDRKDTILGDDEFARFRDRLNQSPEYLAMQQSQKDLEDRIAMEQSRPYEPNLKGLAAFIDNWTGSKLADAAPKVETPAERNARILEYTQKLASDKKDALTALATNLKANKGGTQTDFEQAITDFQNKEMAQDPYKAVRQMSPERKVFMLNSHVQHQLKPLDEERTQIKNAQGLLASGSPIADIAAMDSTLKSLIGGRLTNYDLQRQKGDPSWAERFNQAIETVSTGKLTQQNRAEFASALRTISEAMEGERAARIQQARDLGKAVDIPQDTIDLALQGYERPAVTPHGEAKTAIKATSKNKTPDMIRVEDKNGNRFMMPAGNLQKALQRGYKQVQ